MHNDILTLLETFRFQPKSNQLTCIGSLLNWHYKNVVQVFNYVKACWCCALIIVWGSVVIRCNILYSNWNVTDLELYQIKKTKVLNVTYRMFCGNISGTCWHWESTNMGTSKPWSNGTLQVIRNTSNCFSTINCTFKSIDNLHRFHKKELCTDLTVINSYIILAKDVLSHNMPSVIHINCILGSNR